MNIFAYNAQGTLTNSTSGEFMVGKDYTLGFEENDEYQFVEWVVKDAADKIVDRNGTDKIKILSPYLQVSRFQLLSECENYKIEAVCSRRPVVQTVSPIYLANGVNLDSSIEITFATAVSEEAFYFSTGELNAYGKNASPIYDASGTKITGINIAGNVIYKNLSILDSEGNNIAEYYNYPVFSEDHKSVVLSSNVSNIIKDESFTLKDISVVVFSDVSSDYETTENTVKKVSLGSENYSFKFRLSSQTSEKAKISFVTKNSDNETVGTLNYEGTQEFNIGKVLSLEFTPEEDFAFISWSITGAEDAVSVLTEDNKITIQITGPADNIVVTPVCKKIDSCDILFACDYGTLKPEGTKTYKKGEQITVSYSWNSEYYFAGWKFVNTVTDEILSEDDISRYFTYSTEKTGETSIETVITVTDVKDAVAVMPDTYERPRIYAKIPFQEVKTRDECIKVYFEEELDPVSLYYTEEEINKLNNLYDVTELLKQDSYVYGFVDSDDNTYFKIVEITDRYTGENYIKYYDKPYFIDSKTLCIPVKQVFENGVLDENYLPPANTSFLVKLKTNFGFYSTNGTLIPLAKTDGLTWFYGTNGETDSTKPEFTSISSSTTGIYLAKRKVKPVNLAGYKEVYIDRVQANSFNFSLNLTDEGENLSALVMKIKQLTNSTYADVDVEEKSKVLNLNVSQKTGTCNINNDFSYLEDGLYEIWFTAKDSVDNTTDSDSYYILLDRTGPEDYISNPDESMKIFITGYNKITLYWETPAQKSFDYEKIVVTCDGKEIETSTSGTSLTFEFKDLELRQTYYECTFRIYDVFGNVTVSNKSISECSSPKKGMLQYVNISKPSEKIYSTRDYSDSEGVYGNYKLKNIVAEDEDDYFYILYPGNNYDKTYHWNTTNTPNVNDYLSEVKKTESTVKVIKNINNIGCRGESFINSVCKKLGFKEFIFDPKNPNGSSIDSSYWSNGHSENGRYMHYKLWSDGHASTADSYGDDYYVCLVVKDTPF